MAFGKNKEERASSEKQTAKKKKGIKHTHSNRRNVWLLIVTAILVIVSVGLFVPPQEKINQGLDIQGGLSVVLSAESTNGEDITSDDMEKSRAIIESRVNALGASEATVQIQGNNQILVQIPGLDNPETALATIGRTGKLEFARADSFTNSADQTAITNGTYAQKETYTDSLGNTFQGENTTYRSVTAGTYTPLITGENITRVTVDKASDTSSYYSVDLTLNSEGTAAFAEATTELAPTKGQIVIILDGQIMSAPAVQSAITTGEVSITGDYTIDEAKSLQTVLESGSLPVSFHYETSQVVGPTLGQDALATGVLVALIGLLLVICYLIVFYRGLGILTAVAMAVFSILYLGVLAGLSALGLFSLSLAGVAGIVLTIGMAADSSILTLERFREEIRMGRSVRAASITGVKHAIQTSIDADLVTLVSALTLFFLASASVKGFGMTLALGIFCDIAMMLLLKAPLVRLLAPKVMAHHPGFWGIKDSQDAAPIYAQLVEEASAESDGKAVAPREDYDGEGTYDQRSHTLNVISSLKGKFIRKDIPFMRYRKVFLIVSACLVVLSLGVAGIKGLDFSIEFVGGTSTTFTDTGSITADQVRAAFEKEGTADAIVQTTDTNGTPGFLVRTSNTSAEDAAVIATAVAKDLGISTDNYQINTVGPDWGSSVIQSSVTAFLVSLILIIIYVAIRFEYKMGVMAVVALLHDLIIVVGIYALVGREISPNTIAALLTILGYSLYDTVVVFHRINDNMKESKVKTTFMSMANHSVNQVFIRTINTTLTSIVPVLAMLLFGSETLKDFAFAMAIGLIAGSYSSIGVATPLFAMWKTREPKNAKLQRKLGKDIDIFTFASTVIKPALPAAPVLETAAAGVTEQVVEQVPVAVEAEPKPKQKQNSKPKNSNKNSGKKQSYHYRKKKK